MLKNSNPAMVPGLGHIFAQKGGLPQLSKNTLKSNLKKALSKDQ